MYFMKVKNTFYFRGVYTLLKYAHLIFRFAFFTKNEHKMKDLFQHKIVMVSNSTGKPGSAQ